MARAYRGLYSRQSSYVVPYATASVWGTGIDPIHSYYGEGPPLRVLGREGTIGSSPVGTEHPRSREYRQPADSFSLDPPENETWGYPVDYSVDSFGSGADAPISVNDATPGTVQYMADRPSFGDITERERIRRDTKTMPPWNRDGSVMRAVRAGSHRFRIGYPKNADYYQPVSAEPSNAWPTETVSEGWVNKAHSEVAHAEPSDPSQYDVQTSMRQRFGTRENVRAVMRDTDDARSDIPSRVEPMVEKVYSTGERLYDMYPYQIDQMLRPFRNRTAGVGPAGWMQANEYNALTPVQRTPPPDPAMGVPEVPDFGYTQEDTMYYA